MGDYKIWTDGACSGNPGPGGWAALVVDPSGDEYEASGFDPGTTNNRMELTAALEAIRFLPEGASATVTTDSRYVISCVTDWAQGWIRRGWRNSRNEPVMNKDLISPLYREASARDVAFLWVRGHSGDPNNEWCDREAVRRCRQRQTARGR